MTLVTRQNKLGGPKLKRFPISIDPDSNALGYKLGYCGKCSEPLIMRLGDTQEVVNAFGGGTKARILEWMLRK